MRIVNKPRAAFGVVKGGREEAPPAADMNVKLRAEQTTGVPHKLTRTEVEELRHVQDQGARP